MKAEKFKAKTKKGSSRSLNSTLSLSDVIEAYRKVMQKRGIDP